jgi:hypothetical protein
VLYAVSFAFFNPIYDIGDRLVRSIHGIDSIDSTSMRIQSGSYKISKKIPDNLSLAELVLVLPPFLASKLSGWLVVPNTTHPLIPHLIQCSWVGTECSLWVSKMVVHHLRCHGYCCRTNNVSCNRLQSSLATVRYYHC